MKDLNVTILTGSNSQLKKDELQNTIAGVKDFSCPSTCPTDGSCGYKCYDSQSH